jgi:hypothetical protein
MLSFATKSSCGNGFDVAVAQFNHFDLSAGFRERSYPGTAFRCPLDSTAAGLRRAPVFPPELHKPGRPAPVEANLSRVWIKPRLRTRERHGRTSAQCQKATLLSTRRYAPASVEPCGTPWYGSSGREDQPSPIADPFAASNDRYSAKRVCAPIGVDCQSWRRRYE